MPGWALALPIALLTLIPVAAVIGAALSPQPEVWDHLIRHVLPRVTANTALLMLLVGLGVLCVGVPLAWLTALCVFPGQRFFAWALMLPLAFPAYVLAFVQMGLFEFAGPVQSRLRDWFGSSAWFPEIRGSLWGTVLVLTMAFYPYVYLLTRNAFVTQGRRALEAARMLGESAPRAFWRVSVPMARPWIVGGLALAWMETLADFGAVAVFNYDTFTTALYKAWFDLHNLGAAAQLAALLVLLVLVMAAAEQRSQRGRSYQVASSHCQPIVLRGWHRWVAFGACALVFAASFAIPIVQLVLWSLSTWREELEPRYWDFARNTVLLAVGTAFIATTLSLVLAGVRRRHADRITAWVVRLAVIGYAVPGVVLAVGVFIPIAWLDNLLIAWLRPLGFEGFQILKGSVATMLLALSARFLAVAYHASDSAMQRITRSQEETARTLGLGSWGLLRRLYLPLLRGGLLTAFLMVMVDVMKEMPITLMTRSFGWDTLAVRVFQLTTESMWENAAVPALAIVAVGLLPVVLIFQRAERIQGA
ncbi:iron ABC transporter permease [Pseudothauera nasutitermitis]|uniref:Iron ABC transporter permease n=1 Tax=Pseudothauera nasutitermitis TaxID=2565930 RepID=A0A4S4B4H5_9RHOO|nr:iron ABC transporter permease [Pseudothauera nasutitermitis]